MFLRPGNLFLPLMLISLCSCDEPVKDDPAASLCEYALFWGGKPEADGFHRLSTSVAGREVRLSYEYPGADQYELVCEFKQNSTGAFYLSRASAPQFDSCRNELSAADTQISGNSADLAFAAEVRTRIEPCRSIVNREAPRQARLQQASSVLIQRRIPVIARGETALK